MLIATDCTDFLRVTSLALVTILPQIHRLRLNRLLLSIGNLSSKENNDQMQFIACYIYRICFV
jgi:hypothetical protein